MLSWVPASLTDLIPIEHMWDLIDGKSQQYLHPPASVGRTLALSIDILVNHFSSNYLATAQLNVIAAALVINCWLLSRCSSLARKVYLLFTVIVCQNCVSR